VSKPDGSSRELHPHRHHSAAFLNSLLTGPSSVPEQSHERCALLQNLRRSSSLKEAELFASIAISIFSEPYF
jgi:hypothetical protein